MHPKIKAVGFTGSISGGRAIFDLANSRKEPIPVFAEMGSVNPVIFLDSAFLHDRDKWSSIYADSISASTGQFCTNPGLLFMVQSHESEEFVQAVTQKFLEKEASCMLNPTILANFNSNKANRVSVEGVSFKEKNGELQANYASQTIAKVSGSDFLKNSLLQEEVFGPFSIAVMCNGLDQLYECVSILNGQLTASLIGSEQDLLKNNALINLLQNKVGRLIFNGVPTGVEINPSMQHGGPYPSSTDSRFTAVGIDSIKRFARPITYQNCPDAILPSELKDHNPLNLKRRVNGKWS
jgi:NADP-dependent aldehyde dehydrogenase